MPTIHLDNEHTAWMQANRRDGNMVEGLSPDWAANRERALRTFSKFTTARQVVRAKPLDLPGLVDLDRRQADDMYRTDALITTNPEHILHINPVDCGIIAVHGTDVKTEKEVIAIAHASRRLVGQGAHIRPLEYMAQAYNIDPEAMDVRLAPSARVESYKLEFLSEELDTDLAWSGYIHEGENGWHVDVHKRTIDDLVKFGIQPANIYDDGIDTISHPDYFSRYQEFHEDLAAEGGNGLFFALR